jgi:hypothetical protein
MRSAPLQRLPARGSGFVGRVCLARPPAPSGFLNLLAPRSAPSLLALFHARSAHGVRPPELCSSRTAVRRLRRPYPHGVQEPFRPTREQASRRECRSAAPEPPAPIMGRPSRSPHLQGLAPCESPPHRHGCLGRAERVALMGFPPPGCSPSLERPWLSPQPPLMRFFDQAPKRPADPSPGSRFQ